jgi:hypothetical protein
MFTVGFLSITRIRFVFHVVFRAGAQFHDSRGFQALRGSRFPASIE